MSDEPTQLPRASESTVGILPALLQAQAAFGEIVRTERGVAADDDGSNRQVYSYATLHAHLTAVRPALNAAGIIVMQEVIGHGRGNLIATKLIHANSGEWLASYLPVGPLVSDDPQEVGSRLTYGRRYALAIMLGLAPKDEDDDGGEAVKKAVARGRRGVAVPVEPAAAQAPPLTPATATPPPKTDNDIIQGIRAGIVAALAAGQDPSDVWMEHDTFLKSINQTRLDDLADMYRDLTQAEPPAIIGLTYAEPV